MGARCTEVAVAVRPAIFAERLWPAVVEVWGDGAGGDDAGAPPAKERRVRGGAGTVSATGASTAMTTGALATGDALA